MAPERKIIAALTRYGSLSDDLIAGLAGIPSRVELAARRRLVRRGAVQRGKVFSGRMAWRAV